MDKNSFNEIENMAQNMGLYAGKEVKKVKKDNELIERVGSAKTLITEDNRQVLND